MKTQILFKKSIEWIFRIEGGDVNDPNDRGGHTRFGISKNAHPEIDISMLTREQAEDIYYLDYWMPTQCHRLPPALAVLVFDSAVNHGVRTAATLLQHTLGVKADGSIGPVTLRAADNADARSITTDFLCRRAQLYISLVNADSKQARFLRGWLRRLFLLQSFIYLDVLKGSPELGEESHW